MTVKNGKVPPVWLRTADLARELTGGNGELGVELNNGRPTGFPKVSPKISISKQNKGASVGFTAQWEALMDLCGDYCPTGVVYFTLKDGDPVGKFDPHPRIDPSKPSSIPKKSMVVVGESQPVAAV